MVKHLKDWDISANLKQRHSIYVRPFTGTKVRSMKDYAKPCIREDNLDHIILHVELMNQVSKMMQEESVNQLLIL